MKTVAPVVGQVVLEEHEREDTNPVQPGHSHGSEREGPDLPTA